MIDTETMPDPKAPLVLVFPQWQGAGDARLLAEGATATAELLAGALPRAHVEIEPGTDSGLERGVRARSVVLTHLERARATLDRVAPSGVVTVGGDCGVEVAPIGYLNGLYPGLTVFWIDAHGDLNTPESSPSGNFHGMPLRHLLGDGDADIRALSPAPLDPRRVSLVGVRDLDLGEERFIEAAEIHASPRRRSTEGGTRLCFPVSSGGRRPTFTWTSTGSSLRSFPMSGTRRRVESR